MKHLRLLATLVSLLFFASADLASAQTATANDGWVVLPVGEYMALKRAASPAEPETSPPPVEATLSRIDYDLKVDGELASGEARLTVDVIKNGWVRIAMPEGLMVREAHLDGKPVTLATRPADKGPAGSDLLLSRTGRSVLTLKIVAPVTTVAGTDILRLPISNSAVSHATVEVLRQDVEVRVTGGLLLDHSNTTAGSKWIANGRGNEPLTFGWRRRVDDQRSNQPLRFRGSVTQLIGLGEDSTQVNAELLVQVLQGSAQEISVKLPDQFTVNQVSGAMVADWEATAGELKVKFIEPVQTNARFTLNGELRLPREGQVDVPLIRLPAAERETGGIAVEVLGAGEIKERQANGLDEAEAGELGQLIASKQSPSLIAFRLHPADGKTERTLSLKVARYTPQAVLTANIEQAEYNAIITTEGKLLVQSRFAVRNNQRNFLKLNLPATAVLWSASVSGRPIIPGKAADGSLLLPLEKTKSGGDSPAFIVEVSYMDRVTSWADKGHMRLALVAVDLPISRSRLLLHHSPLYRLAPSPGISNSFRIAPYGAGADPVKFKSGPSSSTVTDTISAETSQLLTHVKEGSRSSTPARSLPVRVAFPHLGPSIFLVSELTTENQIPAVELDFQRSRK